MKKVFVIFALLFTSALCLTACNSGPSVQGEFNKNSYIVSINETINFNDEFTIIKGANKDDVTFVSSNENIIKAQENGDFIAMSSGRAIIFAQYHDETFAQTDVIVKYQYSTPTKPTANENGVMSWQSSFVLTQNGMTYANSYLLEYAKIEDGVVDESEITFTTVQVENSFVLEEEGSYYVRLTALGDEEAYIDNSQTSELFVVNYGVMGIVENVTLETSQNLSDENATLSWQEKEHAVYDVYLNGLKIFENLEESTFTYNFNMVEDGQEVTIRIISKDSEEKLLETATNVVLTRLTTPEINYNYQENGISYIYFNDILNSSSYIMNVADLVQGGQTYQHFEEGGGSQILFEGWNDSLYNLSLMSVGGTNDNGYYLNSKVSDSMLVAKLETPNVEVTFEDSKAILNFSEQYYNNRYLITWGTKIQVFTGSRCEIDLSDLSPDNYIFTIRAIPDVAGGEIVPYQQVGQSTQNIIVSDEFTYDFVILSQISEITHRFEGETSLFGFNEVQSATFYQIYVNGTRVEDAQIDVIGGYVYARVDSLKDYAPINSQYVVTIVAGYENEGVERSPRVSRTKTLTILDTVSAGEELTNRYYSWQKLDNEYAYYEYQIFSANESYEITSEEPVASGGTSENRITEPLSFGYYVIRIYTISTDRNNYLDSTYYDESGYFEDNFLVYEQIETPNVTFSSSDGYRLTITGGEYSGAYQILVNGSVDGEIANNTQQESIVYLLQEQFENAEKYTLQVVATPGILYDGNLHKESQPFELTVTRLALPQFEVREVVNVQDIKTGEEIVVTMVDNAKQVAIKLVSSNGEVVNTDNSNVLDITNYSTNFILSFGFIAGEKSGNDYYIDSFAREVTFNRVNAPTNLSFNEEIVSWDSNDENAEYYYLTLILTNSTNGNYYYRLQTQDTRLNLQDLIDERCEEDSYFASSLRQAENVTVQVYAYANGMANNIYYLPSPNGTTTSGQNSLVLYMLDEPTLSFNSTDRILSWNEVAQNTVYDIYVDGEIVKEDYTNLSINLSDLGDIDFTTSKSVYVIAKNTGYLSSASSNTIHIKQLAQINSINIAQSNGQYVVAFSLNSDLANTGDVYVNGSSDNVNYSSTQNSGTFNLSDFDTDTFTLQVIAQNLSNTYYYINSNETTFVLTDLGDVDFTASLSQDTLSWSAIVNDVVGNNIDFIEYITTITCNGQSYTITTAEISYNIQDIEDKIGVTLSGEVEITVTAKVSKDYTLTLTSGEAKGYYGSKTSEVVTTEKIEAVQNISYVISDMSLQESLLGQKQNAYVVASWQDLWQDKSGVHFIVTISSGEDELELDLTNGSNHENYNLANDGTKYNLTLQPALFGQNNTTLTIVVVSEGNITSEEQSIQIDRLSQISQASVSQDGVLTIDDDNNSFIMQLSIADRVYEERLIFNDDNKTVDLMVEGLLQDVYGHYSIAILSYDQNNLKLPASLPLIITGTKLQGIESSEIDNNGFVNLTLYADNFENLIFTVKTNYKGIDYTFNVSPVETELVNVYMLYIPNMIAQLAQITSVQEGRYTFEVTVSQEGYVRADYHSFTFNYTIEENLPTLLRQNYDQDYFILDVPEDDDTVGVTMLVISYDLVAGGGTGTYYLYDATALKGYWCQVNETGERYFTKTMDSTTEGATYSECYAIDLNELFAEYEQGVFTIEVVRVGRGDVVNIYNAHSEMIYKLNRVEDDDTSSIDFVQINGNNLVWQWRADEILSAVNDYKATAYYVSFTSLSDNESFRVLSYSSALDLRTIDLTPGKVYDVKVTALSSSNYILASNENQNTLRTIKLSVPLPIDVVNGTIVFDEEAFLDTKFMRDITNYFASSTHETALFDTMNATSYLSPFYFFPSSLASQNITLRFTALDSSGAETSTSYSMTVPGYMLFPDITIENNNQDILASSRASYLELLKAYANTLENATAANAIAFKDMVETLDYSEHHGISSLAVLFDDYGRSIPAGRYAVSLYQAGGDGRYIDSEFSQASTIYLTPAPSVSLSQETSGTDTYYMASFGSALTYIADTFDNGEATNYTQGYATSYRMTLRTTNIEDNTRIIKGIIFNIVYHEGSGWAIDFGGTPLEGVITSLGNDVQSGFKINMTLLRERYDEIGEEPIAVNTLIRVDVVATSADNGYVPNGKSAYFNIRYLDLPTDSLSFQNGQMTITTSLESTNSILVRYLARGSELETMVVQINNGIARIDLPREGEYQYIMLSLNGSISYYTMNVESKTYAIENVYKLNSPVLSTQNNNIYVTYNSADFNYTQDQSLHFMLANNLSLTNGENYYYSSTIPRDGRNSITYNVGALDSLGNPIYPTELTAQTFYTYLLGNSGIIEASEGDGQTSHGADYIWTFMAMSSDGNYEPAVMLFSSSTSLIDASMLNVLNDAPRISQGNIEWETIEDIPTLQNASLIYQVEILYYNRVLGENEYDITYDYITRDTYYTSSTSISSTYVSQNYDYYTIEVTPLAGTRVDDDSRAITTIENEKYLIVDSIYYDGTSRHVLRGLTQSLGTSAQPITRTTTPILSPSASINNNGVNNGKIVYYITTNDYGSEVINETSSIDATSRTLLQVTYTIGGQTVTRVLNGSYSYSTSSSSDIDGYVMVEFTPDEGQLIGVTLLSVSIQMYSGSGLLSKALVIDNIYKLNNFNDNYYDILLIGEQTVLDFTNYFRYVNIAGSSANYQIVVEYTTASGTNQMTYSYDDTSKLFTITNEMSEIRVQARDAQTTTATNRLKILFSDTLRFDVENTIVQEEGQNLISITWDGEIYRFVWDWTNGNLVEDYEYYIQIEMNSSSVTSEMTETNFYMPRVSGTITSFSVRARHLSETREDGVIELYLFSQAVYYGNSSITFDLFSGGDGSQSNPYRIANENDFYNISKRNNESETYYFVLTSNITLNNDMLLDDGERTMTTFYGVLNGNGYRLTINADRFFQMSEYRGNITGLSTIGFASYYALFETIAPTSSITNLDIDFIVNTTALNGSNVLISPLALENYGTLDNITIENIEITRLQGSGTINNVFMGGMVGINFGTITNSTNNASFTYNMPQLLNVNFGYSAVSVFNTSDGGYSGSITNTINNGDVTINVRQRNVNVYVSGIVMNNYSTLNGVGNNGNFTQTSTVSCAVYFTGIALQSEGGTISYGFNNGTFEASSSSASNVAGIVYTLYGGTINYLADTKGYAIARICQLSPTDNGVNYALVNSGTVSTISTVELSTTRVSMSNGRYFVISVVDGQFIASIE